MATRALLPALLTASATAGLVALGRRRQLGWGARPGERLGALPGDDLVPSAHLTATRAVTIGAPPEAVMPWLRQIGQDRAGFYSYDALENLVGLRITSAEEIRPEWQVVIGEEVRLAPQVKLDVVRLSPTALVLHGHQPDGGAAAPFDLSWAFVLVPCARGSRLVVRERYGYRAGWAPLVVEPLTWVSWLMTRRMLLGVKERAGTAVSAPSA